jgi:hypothetical protein
MDDQSNCISPAVGFAGAQGSTGHRFSTEN